MSLIVIPVLYHSFLYAVGVMDSDEDDGHVVYVSIGSQKIPLHEVTEDDIHRMTPSEKETYIQQYQEMYSHMYD